MKPFVPDHQVTIYGPDEPLPDLVPSGALVLVRNHGIAASLIRSGQRIRKPLGVRDGAWKSYCRVNHVAIGLSDGRIAQATGRGIVCSTVSELSACCLAVVSVQMDASQAASVVRFAEASIGCSYGFAQVFADVVNAVTGVELALGWNSRMVCSTAACRSIERAGFVPDRSPDCVTPAHLAWLFDVVVPAG